MVKVTTSPATGAPLSNTVAVKVAAEPLLTLGLSIVKLTALPLPEGSASPAVENPTLAASPEVMVAVTTPAPFIEPASRTILAIPFESVNAVPDSGSRFPSVVVKGTTIPETALPDFVTVAVIFAGSCEVILDDDIFRATTDSVVPLPESGVVPFKELPPPHAVKNKLIKTKVIKLRV